MDNIVADANGVARVDVRALGVEVEPVLCDRPARTREARRVVGGLRERVLHRGHEAAAETARLEAETRAEAAAYAARKRAEKSAAK